MHSRPACARKSWPTRPARADGSPVPGAPRAHQPARKTKGRLRGITMDHFPKGKTA